jgi:hypothetical protein
MICRAQEKWAEGRSDTLRLLIAEEGPGYLGEDEGVRVLVCIHTGLQPSEYDRLTSLERVPFLERTAEELGIDTQEYDDSDDDELPTQPQKRFRPPPCKICGGKTRVGKVTDGTRTFYCRDEDCGHHWTATKS